MYHYFSGPYVFWAQECGVLSKFNLREIEFMWSMVSYAMRFAAGCVFSLFGCDELCGFNCVHNYCFLQSHLYIISLSLFERYLPSKIF